MKRALSVYLSMWPIDLVRRRMSHSSAGVREKGTERRSDEATERRRGDPRVAASPKASDGHVNRRSTIDNRQSPIFLTETKAGRDLIVACCEVGMQAGVKPGMTLTHARALLPNIEPHVEPHAPARDLRALHSLAQWMIRFAPTVAVDPPDGLLLDISGCERLYRGERNLVNRLADAVQRLGFHVRIACAPTFACARAVARCGRRQRSMVPTDRVREALGPLSVRALGIDAEVESALHEIAIDRIEHLFNLPRYSLPARFGGELLLRLDRALGQAIERIDPVRPAPPPLVERAFAGPVKQLEAIQITVRDLLQDLARLLLARESGLRRLLLTLERSDLDPLHIAITLSHPSRDVKHLWSLLSPHVERANMGFGVERVALRAEWIDLLPHEQGGMENGHEGAKARRHEGEERDGEQLNLNRQSASHLARARGELIDTLVNRLGQGSVQRMLPVESHVPERAWRMAPVMEKRDNKVTKGQRGKGKIRIAARSRESEGERGAHQSSMVNRQSSIPSVTPHVRPTLLFERPEPIEVLAVTPESPPLRITWRGESLDVIRGCGPERIAESWWTSRSTELPDAGPEEGSEQDPDLSNRQSSTAPSVRALRVEDNRQSIIPLALLQRNYYRVHLESGRVLWVFRHLLTRQWFVHGEWA